MRFLNIVGLASALFGVGGLCSDVWAQFCDDNACSQNCGESVDVTNPGCLDEVGRNSILFHGGDNGEGYGMQFFSQGSCVGEVQCDSGLVLANGCVDLNGNPFASSFQFVPYC